MQNVLVSRVYRRKSNILTVIRDRAEAEEVEATVATGVEVPAQPEPVQEAAALPVEQVTDMAVS